MGSVRATAGMPAWYAVSRQATCATPGKRACAARTSANAGGTCRGCKRGGGLQLLHHGRVDQRMLAALRPTMNDAVADRGRWGQALRFHSLRNAGQSRLRVANRFFRTGDQHAASACAHHEKTELERRRAYVQRQHGSACVITHAGQRQSRTSGKSSPCSLI